MAAASDQTPPCSSEVKGRGSMSQRRKLVEEGGGQAMVMRTTSAADLESKNVHRYSFGGAQIILWIP